MDRPKYLMIFARAGVPGLTTSRARTSASTIGIFLTFKREEAVDFPVAIPPVKPITERLGINPKHRGIRKKKLYQAFRS